MTKLGITGVNWVTVATITYAHKDVQAFTAWMKKFDVAAIRGRPVNGAEGREEVVHIPGKFTNAQIRSSLLQHGVGQ